MKKFILLCLFSLLAVIPYYIYSQKTEEMLNRQGKDFAVFFAINEYQNSGTWQKLKNPVSDAVEISKTLEEQYGFQVERVGFDKKGNTTEKLTEKIITDTLDRYSSKPFPPNSQLLVFFSGHGSFNKKYKKGYFIPYEATSDIKSFIDLTNIRNILIQYDVLHLLLVLDSCYSGTMIDEIAWKSRPDDSDPFYLENNYSLKSRLLIASGGKEKTPDDSQLIRELLKTFRSNRTKVVLESFLEGFTEIRPKPEVGTLTKEKQYHEPGGNFFFIKKNSNSTEANKGNSEFSIWIQSEPEGAKVTDTHGEILAKNTPIEIEVKGKIGEEKKLVLRKDEYEDLNFSILLGSERTKNLIMKKVEGAGFLDWMLGNKKKDRKEELVKEIKPITKVGIDNKNLKTFKNSIGMEFILIPVGEFMMGCSEGDDKCDSNEKPAHNVKITKSFYMGKYEVTQKQWIDVMGKNPSYFKDCVNNCPVENVSWDDIQEYLKKLNKKENKNYRLPTEAEWEYAARAGTTTPFNTGDNVTTDQANYDGNYPYKNYPKGKYLQKTTPVGSYAPNAFGLYDIHGNVWERCQDWYGEKYYSESQNNDPTGPATGEKRVLRGGSCYFNAFLCRSSNRVRLFPANASNDVGFRLVATVLGANE